MQKSDGTYVKLKSDNFEQVHRASLEISDPDSSEVGRDRFSTSKCRPMHAWIGVALFVLFAAIIRTRFPIGFGKCKRCLQGSTTSLSVMSYNTFLLEVPYMQFASKPAIPTRAAMINSWFQNFTARRIPLPDVLVLTEIWSPFANRLIVEKMCGGWSASEGDIEETYVACEGGSLYAFATRLTGWSPAHNGGVVVFFAHGVEMLGARFIQYDRFAHLVFDDSLSRKGFWLIRSRKGNQNFTVVATHASAGTSSWAAGARESGFEAIRWTVFHELAGHSDDEPVLYVGDMNTEADGDYDRMLEALQAKPIGSKSPSPLIPGLESAAFSWDPDNFYVDTNAPRDLDYILIDTEASLEHGQYQIVRVESSENFHSGIGTAKTRALSDHWAVFGQFILSPKRGEMLRKCC